MSTKKLPASFRDPCGFVFLHGNTLLRTVEKGYKEQYELLLKSGLYEALAKQGLLVKHVEVNSKEFPTAYKVIKPVRIKHISYPYEWCFGQLKDAALLTLIIQKIALEHGMSLKDASSYNVQFLEGKPVFIDTLSFEKYEEGEPWVAYEQFCQHFLAPLALLSFTDTRLRSLL